MKGIIPSPLDSLKIFYPSLNVIKDRKFQIFLTEQPSSECHKNKIILELSIAPNFYYKTQVSFTASAGNEGAKGHSRHQHSQLEHSQTRMISYTKVASTKETEFAIKASEKYMKILASSKKYFH